MHPNVHAFCLRHPYICPFFYGDKYVYKMVLVFKYAFLIKRYLQNTFFRGGRNRFQGRGRHNENGREKTSNNNDRHTGKHERFNDGGDEEPPSKQSKSEVAASAS